MSAALLRLGYVVWFVVLSFLWLIACLTAPVWLTLWYVATGGPGEER